jgi:hypothetical protein
MPTYDVTWVEWTTWSAEVEADTPEDAERIARHDGGNCDDRGWKQDSFEVVERAER